MKIHTDKLTEADIHTATRAAGMRGVYAEVTTQGSRSRKRSLTMKLTGTSNRAVNPGTSRYADRGQYADRAATFDEWGMVIQALYLIDPEAIIGKYKSQQHFEDVTFERYVSLTQPYAHGNHQWKSAYPGGPSYCSGCEAEFDFGKFWKKEV